MVSASSIIMIVIIIILLIVVYYYLKSTATTMTGVLSAESTTIIACSTFPSSGSTSGSYNFSQGIWFYVDDWSYNYGSPKIICAISTSSPSSPPTGGDSSATPSSYGTILSLTMGKTQNNLEINVLLNCSSASQDGPTCPENQIYTIIIPRFSLQQWNHCMICSNGNNTLDIYMQGKLIKTQVLPYPLNMSQFSTASVYITPAVYPSTTVGFSGWTSQYSYWNTSLDPNKVWEIYKKGYGGSTMGNFSEYQVTVSVSKGSDTVASGSL